MSAEQKEILRLVLDRAILTEDTVKIALYGRPPESGAVTDSNGGRCQMGERLPGLPSQSAFLWDNLLLETRRAARGQTKITISAWQVAKNCEVTG